MTSHKHNFQQVASDKRWVQLTGAMNDVRKDMNKLAPNPHGAGGGECRAATGNSRDSLRAALAGFDYTTAIDLYDEYWMHRQNSENGQKDRANGG